MTVDAQSRRFMDAAASGPFGDLTRFEPAQLRVFDAERNPVDPAARKLVAAVEDRSIDGPDGPVKIRILTPAGVSDPPVVVYYHGGGHGIGSVDVYDLFACHLCHESAAIVVSVDYRLAPEHKFPAGLQDALAATRWVVANRAALGTRSHRIAVAGDSAGGALVAGVTLSMRDAGEAPVDFQVLIYPMLAGNADTESRVRLAQGYYVDRPMIDYYMNHYARGPADFADPLFAPLTAPDLSGLPPALVITAEYDPLGDEGRQYARRLREAGVDIIVTDYGGTIHGFVKRPGVMEKGLVCVRQVGATLRSALGRGWTGA